MTDKLGGGVTLPVLIMGRGLCYEAILLKKRIINIALALCLSILLAVSVSAHPGRTDSSGGHTVSETGEYHYHHGYSAHDHEDLDGDGDLDCPYDFDDKTGISSGGSESSVSSQSEKLTPEKNTCTTESTPIAKQETEGLTPERNVQAEVTQDEPTEIAEHIFCSLFFQFVLFLIYILPLSSPITRRKYDSPKFYFWFSVCGIVVFCIATMYLFGLRIGIAMQETVIASAVVAVIQLFIVLARFKNNHY